MGSFLIFPTSWRNAAGWLLNTLLYPFLSGIHDVFASMWNDIIGTAHALMDWVDVEIARAVGYVSNVTDFVAYVEQHVMEVLFNDLPNLVGSVIHDAIDAAVSFVEDVAMTAERLATSALDLATSAVSVVTDIAGTIGGLVEAGISRAEGLAQSLVDRAVGDLTQWVKDAIGAIRDDLLPWVGDVVKALFPFIDDLATLWGHIFGWLVWLARLPFESLGDLEHAIANRLTWAHVKGGFDDVISRMDEIESAIAHVIG